MEGFTLRGLTIKHASFSGVFRIGVDGYRLTGTRYVDNPVYGPFPVCSHDGLIDFNQVVGGGSAVGPILDTGIYVGDDDQVTVRHNSVTNYVIGVVVENTTNAIVRDNLLKGNTAGIYTAVFPDHPRPFTDDVGIERNQVLQNNLSNPVPADSGDAIGLVPTGAGIVNLGGVSGAQTRMGPLSCRFTGRVLGMVAPLPPRLGAIRVLSRIAYLTLCRSIQLLALLARGDAAKDLELLVLRHQLSVLRRQVPRPRLQPADRALLAAVSRVLPRSRWSCFLVKPETLLRWHRRLVAGAWTYPRGPGRPPLDEDLQALIVRLATENPRWGYQPIQGELLRLGVQVSATAIRTTLRRHRLDPAPRPTATSWRAFLRQQAAGIVDCDLLHRRHHLAAATVGAVPH